jgi:Protein of unknown function (DUF3618)
MNQTSNASDDAERIRQEIERTRQQLGETVERLAAKADVKSRARAEAAVLAGRLKSSGRSAASSARRAMSEGTAAGQRYWVPLSVAAAVLVAAALAVTQRRQR